jgi:tetratricopeptide (TPR) repeat protein
MRKIREAGRQTITPDLATDPASATAALAYTVGLNDAEFGFERLPPRQVRVQTHDAWRSYFSALAQEHPTVVVIEDIHWADPALLDLLEELAERSQGPLLFVCPARPELTQRRPTWGGGKRNFSSIFLEPLSRDDADRLVGFLLSVEDMPPSLHEAILERAEGNPFFLEEILRHLIDEGRIVRIGERWRAAEEVERVVIPDTVQGVLAARIDLLGSDEKRTLQSAAVVGRVFWTGPVGRLLNGQAEQLDEILGKLQERELVLSRLGSSMAGDREYIFKHILTRDVAYESLPRRDRAAAHAQVARWIEETAGDRRREFAELLAYHCSEAYAGSRDDPGATPEKVEELRRRAFEYLMSAAAESRGKAVISKALRLAEQALTLAETPVERAEAMEGLGDIYNTDYRGDLAYRYFREAADLRIREIPDDRRAIALACAKALEVPTRWPGSMTSLPPESEVAPYLQTGLAHVGEGDSEERVRLLAAKAFWPFGFPEEAGGDEDRRESVEAGREAADMALRIGRVDLASAALDGLGSGYVVKGLYGRVAGAVERRLSLAPQLHDPWEIGDMFAMHAWNQFHIGKYREAERAATEGLEAVGETGPAFTTHLLAWRSSARARLGDWEGALEDVAVGGALVGDRTPPPFMRHLFGVGAFISDARGDKAEADRHSEVLRRLADYRRRVRGLLGATFWVANMLVRRGEFAEARELLDTNDASPLGVNIGLGLDARCTLVAAERAWREVKEVLERARSHAEEAGLLALPLAADRLEGRAALAAGDLERAVELLGRARDGFASLEARWEAAVTELSLADALLQTGRREEAANLLAASLAVFDELRSVRELAQTRELLMKLR